MTKKQFNDIVSTYAYYQELAEKQESQAIDFLEGMTRTLLIMGELKKVKNEAYKLNKPYLQQKALENIEFNINHYFGKNSYSVDLLDHYYENIEFEDIPEDAKTAIKFNIERVKGIA